MPSNKNPNVYVNVGPGRVPSGSVDTSSLSFNPAAGGDLQQHITDPVDAHMASAIGINPIHPVTGDFLLTSVGGPYDGESVLDALNALKDLLPVKPDLLGFDNGSIPNSGITNWKVITSSAVKGGFTKSPTEGIVSKYLLPVGAVSTVNVEGVVYPADRGVLALYRSTTGNIFDSANTTLVAALWLGSSPAPSGIPNSAWDTANKNTQQSNYTSSGTGIDKIDLTKRLPYRQSYAAYSNAYSNYTTDFFSYQLATYDFDITLSTGDNNSYLLVHWREAFATSLANIQPSNLTSLTLVTANCYSAVPTDSAFYDNVKRFNVFVDSSSGTGPTGAAFTSTPGGTVTTTKLSGLDYYISTGLTFNVTATATNLFANGYLTNANVTSSVPTGFTSVTSPVIWSASAFGGASVGYDLYDGTTTGLVNNSGGTVFTTSAPPAVGDTARFQNTANTIGGTGLTVPFPHGSPTVTWNAPFGLSSVVTDTRKYLYMPSGLPTYSGSGAPGNTRSTLQAEGFVDEDYRYTRAYTTGVLPNTSARVDPGSNPAAAGEYNSVTALGGAATEGDLQVLSGRLVYPQVDYTISDYRPAQSGRDYSLATLGDVAYTGSNPLLASKRSYVRAFNTNGGQTGILRISGLPFAAFQTSGAAVTDDFTDHPGGCFIQIRATGATVWQDLGRAVGVADGALQAVPTTDGVTGELVVPYQIPAPGTVANGSGENPLFVKITFLYNGTGENLTLESIRWSSV